MAHSMLLAFGMTLLTPVWAVQEVRVGAAHFPPYTVRPESGVDTGLLPQLLDALNQLQNDFRFVPVPSSIPRRFRDFDQGRVDMVMFENPAWGWQDIAYSAVDMGLEDAEVFVARQQPDRQQDYFDDLSNKRLALFSGYHYAFAGFNPSPRYLAQHFNATLTYSHESNLLMVLRGRVDVALITRSNLTELLARNPKIKSQVLVSQRIDQIYHHYALLRPQAPIVAPQLAALLQQLRDNGQIKAIFEPFQVAVVPMRRPLAEVLP
ncbi:amino acid ABC transporter substrate-binding protein [Pseudomonas lundensis]|nr:transporter substrate-binding domain-containing protein [Pseudomonas lundensis]NNA24991.1 amino acid ABC transporter substrate-binding protein [Pseudomonas lundensis]